jgi:predicted GIY-YIG superfamily endonuclease
MMKGVMVCPMVYVLELEDDCWYVGITHNLNMRYAQHLSGDGALWTKMHRPKRIYDVYVEDATFKLENEVTRKFIEVYGEDKVRGGAWCQKTVKGKHMTGEQFVECVNALGLSLKTGVIGGPQSKESSKEASE